MPYSISSLWYITLLSPVPGLVDTVLTDSFILRDPCACVLRQQRVAGGAALITRILTGPGEPRRG